MSGKTVVKMKDLPKGQAFIIDDTAFFDKDGNVVECWSEVQRLEDQPRPVTHKAVPVVGAA